MSDRIVFGHDVWGRAVAQAVGHFFNPECDTIIAREVDEQPAGGVLLTNFTGESMQIHVAGFRPRWLSRDLLWVSFDYPFRQLGVERLFSQMQETNGVARAFNLRLGFRQVARIEGVYPGGVACIVTVMEESWCRHLMLRPRNLVPNYSLSKRV